MEHCKGCVTGIFGVHSLIPFYQKKGFTISEYARMYTGKSAKVDIKLPILPYNEEEHYNDIAEYDKNCFPGDRKEFLKRWLKKSNALTFVYYDSNKKLKGYASIFKSNVEWDISPCYCDSKEIAKALIGSLLNKIPEQSDLEFYVTTKNPAAIDLFNEISPVYKMEYHKEEFAIMYNGTPKDIDTQKCFCLVSPAVG